MDNNTTDYYYNTQILLDSLYSSWLIDSFYLFLITPLELVGLALNLLSFLTLCRFSPDANKTIFKYMRVYTINAVLACMVSVFAFGSFSPRYFQFALGYFTRLKHCFFDAFVFITFYFFCNLLDVAIALDRLSLLAANFNRFKASSPYKVSLALLLLCITVNVPILFLQRPKSDHEFYNLSITTSDNYCYQLEFSQTITGKLFNFLSYFVRDILTLVVEIAFGIMAIAKLHKFRIRDNLNEIDNGTFHDKVQESERKLILMTIYLSLISIASHFVVFLASLVFIANLEHIFNGWLQFASAFSLSVKHISNFFALFYHSRVFRIKFRKLVHCL